MNSDLSGSDLSPKNERKKVFLIFQIDSVVMSASVLLAIRNLRFFNTAIFSYFPFSLVSGYVGISQALPVPISPTSLEPPTRPMPKAGAVSETMKELTEKLKTRKVSTRSQKQP